MKVINVQGRKKTGKTTTVTNIISGIGNTIDELIAKATEVWQSARDAVANFGDAFLTVGGDIVRGIASGISNAVDAVRTAISNVIGNAIDWAKGILGIASPSKVFKRFGRFIDEGLAIGIKEETDQPVNAVVSVVQEVSFAMDELADHTEGVASQIVSAVETVGQALQYVANQDYAALMMEAKSLDEFEKYAELRAAKIAGEGMDLEALGYATNDELLAQWKSAHGSAMSSALSGAGSHSDYGSSASRGGITIVINAAQGQSEDSIAAKVERKLMEALGQREAVWG